MRYSISGNMLATKLKVLHHVLKILEIETKGQQILLDQGIDHVSKIIHTKAAFKLAQHILLIFSQGLCQILI